VRGTDLDKIQFFLKNLFNAYFLKFYEFGVILIDANHHVLYQLILNSHLTRLAVSSLAEVKVYLQ